MPDLKKYEVTVEVAEDGTRTLRSFGKYDVLEDGELVTRSMARSSTTVDPTKTSNEHLAAEKLILEGKIGESPMPTLDELKAAKLAQNYLGLDGFFETYWKLPHKITLLFFSLVGVKESLVNRNAKFQQIVDWVMPVYQHYYDLSDSIDAATTEAELDAITIDFEQFAAAKPAIEIRDIVTTLD